jgi:hypothetical protein
MARGLRQPANEPELEFVPEEQELEFVPESQDGNLTKAQYIASGGRPEDVISPEREAVLQAETQRQLQAGATPEQAAVAAGQAVDQMGAIKRPDGTIAEGYKPTEQALREGIIEQPAIPAVKEAQRLGIETVSSGTDKDTGGGFAVGKTKEGKLVRIESSPEGEVDVFEIEEQPSRLGAVARTVAREFLPSTAAGAAARAGFAVTPGPLPARLVGGLAAGTAAYLGAQKAQQAALGAALGPERMARVEEVLQRDIQTYPVTTTAAAILTPTAAGVAGLGRQAVAGIRGALAPAAREVAEAVPAVAAKEVAAAAPAAVRPATEVAEAAVRAEPPVIPPPAAGMGIRKAGKRIVEDPLLDRNMREQLAKSEDIQYAKFGQKALQDELVGASDDAVRNLAATGTTAQKVVAQAELINRASRTGDVTALGELARSIIKLPTEGAQVVAAMRTLSSATPQGYLYSLNTLLDRAGRQFTPELLSKARRLFDVQSRTRQTYERLAEVANRTLDDADIAKAIRAEKIFTESAFRLQNFESRLLPKRFFGETLPTVIQGNLLAPLSIATNLWSNAVSALPRLASRQGAFIAQEVTRAFQGMFGKAGPRVISSPISISGARRVGESIKGLGRGLVEGAVGIRRGISAEGLLAGEKIRGFQPLQAWKQFWTGSGLAKPVQQGWRGLGANVLDRARLAAEGALGAPPETMLRLLQLGDTPFRRMAQARLLAESVQLQRASKISTLNDKLGLLVAKTNPSKKDISKINEIRKSIETISKRDIGKEISTAVRLPGKKELAKIEEEAAQAVFQQDTPLSRAALHAANMFGLGSRFGPARALAKTIIPYAKTPANVIDEMLDYSLPGYALVFKGIPAMKAGNAREAQLAIGKTLTSLTIGAIAKTLSDEGIIGGRAEESEKARDIQYKALPPRTINISALNRYANGEATDLQPGDRVINLEKLGIVGGMLATWDAASKATEGGDFISPEFVTALVPETLSFAMNQSFLKGTNSLLSAMLDGQGATMDKWIEGYFGTISAIPFPNTLSAVSRSMREAMPDKVQIKDVEGEGVERTINLFGEVLKRRLPGADEDIPRRIDVWGREVPQTPEGADPIAYNFFDVTKGREVTYDPITLEIYKIFKATEDGDVIPPKPQRNFVIDNVKYRLSPELYEEYSIARGRANRQAAEQLIRSPSFRKLSTEDKVVALRSAYNQIGEDARRRFLAKNQARIKRGEVQ